MFDLITVLGYGMAGLLMVLGARRFVTRKDRLGGLAFVAAGLLVAAVVVGGLWFLDFWGEYLWYRTEGYGDRFLTTFWAQWQLAGAGALAASGLAWGLARIARSPGALQWLAAAAGAGIGAFALTGSVDEWLLFQSSLATGTVDPILGKDVSFYLFHLPFYQIATWPLFLGVVIGGTAALLTTALRVGYSQLPKHPLFHGYESRDPGLRAAPERAAILAGAALLLLLGLHIFLSRFGYIVSGSGIASGAGYTDVNWRIPGAFVASVAFGIGALLAVGLALSRRQIGAFRGVVALAPIFVAAALLWIVAVGMLPSAPQRFQVAPNELAVEAPYIRHSMQATRAAFGIDAIEERRPNEVAALTSGIVDSSRDILREVPLWDYRALVKVFGQLQRMRPYYEIPDVDIDRYLVNGEYRQVMISAREMNQDGLPEQSRTFVNTRFKYTHGYGVVAVPVNEFSGTGQPTWWARDIPATASLPEFVLERPEIYFGEMTTPHVYVKTTEPEFHYPAGERNEETFYQGTAGIVLDNLAARLAYAKRFDGTRVFTSRYLTAESRILFRRQIKERVSAIAPFLYLDEDPYIVVSEGRLFWILDAYTYSNQYPYSERFSVENGRVNLFRNAVKVVVDAYNGTVSYYVFDETDPVIQTWGRVFPGMFQPASAMSQDLRAHVRYPELLLHTQGRVYAKYHMEDLNVFYNQEDLWIPATELYYGQERAVEPYYTLWRTQEQEHLEFVIKWPFTPRGRHQLSGWLAGRADGDQYGQLIAYKLPKDRLGPGPQQFEAKIDSDPELSNLLLSWNRAGSRVLRGHVLTIPLGGSIVHVEPIYLESERASMPELQLVAVMQGEHFASGRTLDEAIRKLLGRSAGVSVPLARAGSEPETQTGAQQPPSVLTMQEAGRQANAAFLSYLRLQAEGRFEEAAQELNRLRAHLAQLAGE